MNGCKLCKGLSEKRKDLAPMCAFPRGVFSRDNWNCATMNALRYLARERGYISRDDLEAASIGVLRYSEGYIVMTWYKERGPWVGPS